MFIDLLEIDTSYRTMLRYNLVPELVGTYAEEMKKGMIFPPVILFSSDEKYFIGDGFHRLAAAAKIGLSEIEAEIHPGGYPAALLYSAGANDKHGLRRSRKDMKNAIKILLCDPETCGLSDLEIAKAVHTDHTIVDSVRKELVAFGKLNQITE